MTTATILLGDVLERLREIPDQSVQCCVTSPPYWGLRDYGLPPSIWGGDAACDHSWESAHCRCGAWRGCLGLEPTPAMFIENLVAVFQEVRRTLRKDGVCFINLGDSYAGSGKGPSNSLNKNNIASHHAGNTFRGMNRLTDTPTAWLSVPKGLKAKDLIGIPWRAAFALQADGWWLRQDIIWSKPNCMPESVTDRCTRSHEYIFMLTKSAKYHYDAEAIRTPAVPRTDSRPFGNAGGNRNGDEGRRYDPTAPTRRRSDKQRGHSRRHNGFNDRWDAMPVREQMANGANRRSVWTISTKPYRGAHFATFPPDLPELCILAGTRHGDTVLDPFSGAGTTALVSQRLGRNSIGIERNPDYVEMSRKRIEDDAGMLCQVEVR